MRIVFIKPPQTYLLDPQRNPPLGMLYVAATASQAGYAVQIVDLSAAGPSVPLENVPEGDIYAFTVSILDYEFSLKLARKLKSRGAIVVFGGILPTVSPEVLDPGCVDSVVRGEGETSFLRLLEDVEQGRLKPEYTSPPIADLNEIPFPLRQPESTVSTKLLAEQVRATTLITSRGCPFRCSFCASQTIWGRKVRFRSVENVMAEIDLLVEEYAIQGLRFLDDTLTLKKPRLLKLCERLKDYGLLWRCSTRSTLVTEETARMMYDGGCREIGLGVESADQEILDLLDKEVTVEDHETAIRILHAAGIRVGCFFMAGLPGETESTAEKNIAFMERTQPDRVFCSTFMPYPGTPIWNEPQQYGVTITTRDLSCYNQVSGPGENREFVAIPEQMSRETLAASRTRMMDYLASRELTSGA